VKQSRLYKNKVSFLKQNRTKIKKTDLITQTVPIKIELLITTRMGFLKQAALKDTANSKHRMVVILRALQTS
jgi:hypothetical protein